MILLNIFQGAQQITGAKKINEASIYMIYNRRALPHLECRLGKVFFHSPTFSIESRLLKY